MAEYQETFLNKAEESLEGAESEFANGRYNNCANRCYYACFQAAVAALIEAGVGPRSGNGQWGHDFVQAEFVGQLVNRRKTYSTELRDVLSRLLILRQTADYQLERVTETQAVRALRRTRGFLDGIQTRGGGPA